MFIAPRKAQSVQDFVERAERRPVCRADWQIREFGELGMETVRDGTRFHRKAKWAPQHNGSAFDLRISFCGYSEDAQLNVAQKQTTLTGVNTDGAYDSRITG